MVNKQKQIGTYLDSLGDTPISMLMLDGYEDFENYHEDIQFPFPN